MCASAASPAPPTLRLNIQRAVYGAAVAATALQSGTLASIAIVRFENAVFQPTLGLELSHSGRVSIAFPDPRTLQIVVPPDRRRRDQRVAVFAPSFTVLANLGVRLDEAAIALVGELAHTKGLGELSVQVAGRTGISLLSPAAVSLPFAVPVPADERTEAPSPRRAILPARLAHRLAPSRAEST